MNLTQATSIINQMTYELAEANDAAERRAELQRQVEKVQERAEFVQGIHRSIFPNGTWGPK